MKNLVYSILLTLAVFSIANAQGVDLKAIKAEREAEAVKKFTDLLGNFYRDVFLELQSKTNGSKTGLVAKVGSQTLLKKALEVRSESHKNIDQVQRLISLFRIANHFDEQFDKDLVKLLGSNKVKGRVVKIGARKLFESNVSSSALNNFKEALTEVATTLEVKKDEDVCNFLAVGIAVEVLSSKKPTVANNKWYEAIGCHK